MRAICLCQISAANIYKFSPAGVRTTFASGLNGPGALAFDRNGNLFVVLGVQILKFTPCGVESIFASGLNYPYDLAFDSGGNLFVTDGWGQHLYNFTPAGVRTTFAVLGAPEGLAFDSAGDLFVVDGYTEKILQIHSDRSAKHLCRKSARSWP